MPDNDENVEFKYIRGRFAFKLLQAFFSFECWSFLACQKDEFLPQKYLLKYDVSVPFGSTFPLFGSTKKTISARKKF